MKGMTGIEALDRGLDGGPAGPSSLLLYSEGMAEKRIFAEQFLVTGLRKGETCLYVDLYRTPSRTRREFAKFGDIPHDLLVVLGVAPPGSGGDFALEGSPDPENLLELIGRVLDEKRPRRIVFDSLDLLAERLSPEALTKFLRELTGATRAAGAMVGLLFMQWGQGPKGPHEALSSGDYLLEFRSTLRSGALHHKLRLRENDGGGRSTRWIPFGFREGRGLVLCFPRVLVTGPHGAGKSSLIRELAQTAVSGDPPGTDVALDSGGVAVSGVEIELLGAPGRRRFEFLLPVLVRGADGQLLVVDSTNVQALKRATQLRRLVGERVPTVVVANKQDRKEAISSEAIREGLDLEDTVPVIEAVASEGKGVSEALQRLIDLMIWGWSDA